MSQYLSVDHYKHTSQTHPDDSWARVTAVTDDLNQLGRKLDAVRFTDEAFAQEQVTKLSELQQSGKTLPLQAVPLAHKELYGRTFKDGSGWPNEGGSKTYEDTLHPALQQLLTNWILQGRSTAGGWFLWNMRWG